MQVAGGPTPHPCVSPEAAAKPRTTAGCLKLQKYTRRRDQKSARRCGQACGLSGRTQPAALASPAMAHSGLIWRPLPCVHRLLSASSVGATCPRPTAPNRLSAGGIRVAIHPFRQKRTHTPLGLQSPPGVDCEVSPLPARPPRPARASSQRLLVSACACVCCVCNCIHAAGVQARPWTSSRTRSRGAFATFQTMSIPFAPSLLLPCLPPFVQSPFILAVTMWPDQTPDGCLVSSPPFCLS